MVFGPVLQKLSNLIGSVQETGRLLDKALLTENWQGDVSSKLCHPLFTARDWLNRLEHVTRKEEILDEALELLGRAVTTLKAFIKKLESEPFADVTEIMDTYKRAMSKLQGRGGVIEEINRLRDHLDEL